MLNITITASIGGFENSNGNGDTGAATVVVNFASPAHVGATFLLGVAVSLVGEVSSKDR